MNYRPEYDPKVIGRNLRRLREAKCLKVKEVAEYLHAGSPQQIYNYESGAHYPQADTLLALMQLYEATPADLVEERITVAFQPDDTTSSDNIPGEDVVVVTNSDILSSNIFQDNQSVRKYEHLKAYCELLKRLAS